jgi:hypothetical protein
MNATLREVFEEDRYSPLDAAELRLSPNAAISGDPNVQKCFSEAELASKCPSLLYKPEPKPPVPTQCLPYTEVNWGDGYKDTYGEPDNGGFKKFIDASKIEKYSSGTCPATGSLPGKNNVAITIKNGGVVFTMLPRVAQAVQSVKWNGMEYLASPLFSTAALNVPIGASDKVARVDEAGASSKVKTTSKVIKVTASDNAAYTQVQASYNMPPGSFVNGKKVVAGNTLSTTNIEKRVSIAANRVVRYQTSVIVDDAFVSGRFNLPKFDLKPELKKIFVYKKSTHSWSNPAEAKLTLDADVLAVIFTTTDHKHAMGLRVIDFPKPQTFGSKFPNSFDINIARGTTSIAVAATLTVGNRGGNGGLYAPEGRYCASQDFIFGTLEYVQDLLNKVLGAQSGTCPKLECPKPSVGTKIIPGKIVSVIDANSFTVSYNNKAGKPVTTKVTKAKHAFKVAELVNVTVALDTWAVKNVTKRGVGPVKPSGKTRVVVGTITKVLSADKVQVTYVKPGGLKMTHDVTKKAHGLKANDDVDVTLQFDVPYLFVSLKKRAAGSNEIVVGKVIKIVSADKVQIQYTKPGGVVAKPVVNKAKHGLKLGQLVDVTLKGVAPYAFVSMKARDTGVHLTLAGTVTKVIDAGSVVIKYKNPGGKLMNPTVHKKAHGLKMNDAIDVVVSKVPPYKVIMIVKNDNVKPTPKPKPAPKPAPGTTIVTGKVVKVIGPDKVQVQYTRIGGSIAKPIVNKKLHKMKLNESIDVTLKNGTFVSIAKKGVKPAPKPVGKNITKDGKVTKVLSKDKVEVTYTSAGKVVKKIVNKKAHGMKLNEIVIVEETAPPAHVFVAIRKKTVKPSPKPVLKPLGSSCGTVSPASRKACCQKKKDTGVVDAWCTTNFPKLVPTPKPTPVKTVPFAGTVPATVIKVVDAGTVQVSYVKPGGGIVKPIVKKPAHAMKLNEIVVAKLKTAAPYALVSISKKI